MNLLIHNDPKLFIIIFAAFFFMLGFIIALIICNSRIRKKLDRMIDEHSNGRLSEKDTEIHVLTQKMNFERSEKLESHNIRNMGAREIRQVIIQMNKDHHENTTMLYKAIETLELKAINKG